MTRDAIIIPGRIPPASIGFVNSLLDDHDGMVIVRTEEPKTGKMEFWVSPDMVEQFRICIEAISKQFDIEIDLFDPIERSTEIKEFPKLD